jgi:hypothetical protein
VCKFGVWVTLTSCDWNGDTDVVLLSFLTKTHSFVSFLWSDIPVSCLLWSVHVVVVGLQKFSDICEVLALSSLISWGKKFSRVEGLVAKEEGKSQWQVFFCFTYRLSFLYPATDLCSL